MRKAFLAAATVLALGACSTAPRSLVPDTPLGPASYVCYSTMTSEPAEVRAIAEQQCGRWGMQVTGLIGQGWRPLRCGALTPMVAAFQCGRQGGSGYDSYFPLPTPQ